MFGIGDLVKFKASSRLGFVSMNCSFPNDFCCVQWLDDGTVTFCPINKIERFQ
jgi:hypothetical protein